MSHSRVRSILSLILCCIMLITTGMLIGTDQKAKASNETVNVWLTTSDQSSLLQQQSPISFSTNLPSNNTTINVDETQTYQKMDGFGASFADSSAWLVENKMSTDQRNTLMNNLFSSSQGIGLDFLRQPMGASDLVLPSPGEYSYDDMPAGQTDTSLSNFSISHDTAYIIPALKQALQINPDIKIMATPWSPPGWMKTNSSMDGGSLSDYASFAQYFVRFIQAYQSQGIPIYAITPQNEPETTKNMPTMLMTAEEQTNFIKNNLGPALASNGLNTKILVFDHNWNDPQYPETILGDSQAASYSAGTAIHCYEGDVSAQTTIHNAYPDKDIYETECSGGSWEGTPIWPSSFKNIMELLINTTRNWSKTVVRWGLALDPDGNPNLGTSQSCTSCRGVVTIDQNTGNVTYNSDYYGLGHASKFVAPGAYRIASNSFGSNNLEDVAFLNPNGSKALIAYNSGSSSTTFQVKWGNEAFSYTLPAGAAATFTWSGMQANISTTTIDDSVQGSGTNQFNYSGNGWGHCTGCDGNNYGFYNGSNSWDNTPNDSVTINFNGTGIRLYGVVGPDHGIGAVSIDGGTETMVDFYAPQSAGNQIVYSNTSLSSGNHTLKIRVTGKQYARATWNGINPDRVDILPNVTTIDDSVQGSGTNQFNYSGSGWGHCTNCDGNNYGFYNGSNSWDNTTNDAVTVNFTGTGIRFYGVVGPDHGIGAVSIDGGTETLVDFYQPQSAGNQLLYSISSLSSGSHTFKIRVTGNQNSSAGWNGINPDRVDIIS